MTPAAITAASISAEWILDQAAHQVTLWLGPSLTYSLGPVIVVAAFSAPLALLGAGLFFALGKTNDN